MVDRYDFHFKQGATNKRHENYPMTPQLAERKMQEKTQLRETWEQLRQNERDLKSIGIYKVIGTACKMADRNDFLAAILEGGASKQQEN